MNEKIRRFGRWFGDAFRQILRQHPIELAIVLVGCIGCIVAYNLDSDSDYTEGLMVRLALVPIFFALALAVNLLAGRSPWRKLYWVCWLPAIPLMAWSGLQEWVGTIPHRITLGVLAPLALLCALRAVDNRRFVGDAMAWLRAGVLAVFFSNVLLGLFCAILFSTTYIFGLTGGWINDTAMYAVILCETILAPILFLMMSGRWLGAEMQGNKIIDILLNYLITPALLIYMAILDLYILKIVVTWELPVGGVAYLVFGFTILAMVVKALQEILIRRLYDWFFDRFSLFALPAVVLFWVGVMQRVGEYGLTADRVWLLVCGGVMTLSLVLFLSRRTGRYLYVALSAFVVFAVVAYVPPVNPQQIAIRSQLTRAERLARQLDLLDADGHIVLERVSQADTTQQKELHGLYEALQYADTRSVDTAALSRFGLTDLGELREALSSKIESYVVWGYVDNDSDIPERFVQGTELSGRTIPVTGYSRLYTGFNPYLIEDELSCRYDSDTLYVRLADGEPDIVIASRTLIETQLKRVGMTEPYDWALIDEHAAEFLTYSDAKVTILFTQLYFAPDDMTVESASVCAVLVR